ncbi:MAG: lipase [Gammaproteobacteria bacterium]|nr:lipase [Gammaproteobacteria bacterium]
MNYRISNNLLTLTLILLLSACSSNEIYRSDYEICNYRTSGDCPKNALQVHAAGEQDEYRLGFVEYDDQGQLRDRKQMNAVLEEYQQLAAFDDVLLITFVHGWHHSAQPEDGNIVSFRHMLAEVSKMEGVGSEQQGRKKRKVIGLYVGWRGDSISVPYVNDLTFWDRKNTAHDVGHQGVTEVLLKLEEIVNVKIGIGEENPPPMTSRLVVIGHSFGGAVVYASLQKVLAERFVDSRRGKTYQDDAKGFGDLVVLMNPAFEALRFSALYDMSQDGCRGYFSSQLPKLAILTSEADYATRYAFPVGRFFTTLFESHVTLDRHYCTKPGSKGVQAMQINEGKADRNTVGHFEPYLTHQLSPMADQVARKDDFQIKQLQKIWAEHNNDIAVDFVGSQLTSLKRTNPLNPYLNIKVDKELINDHNDIWRPQIVAFIRDLIAISTTPVNVEK